MAESIFVRFGFGFSVFTVNGDGWCETNKNKFVFILGGLLDRKFGSMGFR